MLVSTHVMLSLIVAIILYPFIGLYSIVFFLAGFLIDFDHVIEYTIRKGDYNPFNAYKSQIKEFYKERRDIIKKKKISYERRLYIFHLLEVVAIIGIWGIFSKIAFYIFLGFMFHILLDLLYEVYIRIKYGDIIKNLGKHYSLISYSRRNK